MAVIRGWAAALGLTAAGVLAAAAFAQDAAPAPAGDAAKGAVVFDDRCSGCHALNSVGEGPSLGNVVGRKAASLPGYDYSPALKASGLTWTPAALDRFLTDSAKFVPGTAMSVSVPDPAERRDLIAYLETLSPQP